MPLSLSTGSTRRFDKLRVIVVEARMSPTVALTDTVPGGESYGASTAAIKVVRFKAAAAIAA